MKTAVGTRPITPLVVELFETAIVTVGAFAEGGGLVVETSRWCAVPDADRRVRGVQP